MRTGKQVFEKAILDNIDNTLEVVQIVFAGDPEFNFEVCNTKWLTPGMSFRDENNRNWSVVNVDYDENIVYAVFPGETDPLVFGSKVTIQKPTFWSGTRTNTNDEFHLKQNAEIVTITPIVWLQEIIRLSIPPNSASSARTFRFTWYCLDQYDFEKDLNDDRHRDVIYPMTQLGQEILETIDRIIGLRRETEADSFEFSRFATEDRNGMEKRIFDLNLSGTSYTTSVIVDEFHLCKC